MREQKRVEAPRAQKGPGEKLKEIQVNIPKSPDVDGILNEIDMAMSRENRIEAARRAGERARTESMPQKRERQRRCGCW